MNSYPTPQPTPRIRHASDLELLRYVTTALALGSRRPGVIHPRRADGERPAAA